VWSAPVDEEFLALARRAGAIYVPTLTVPDGYGQVTARHFLPDRGALVCVDRATRSKAFATDTVALAQRAPLSLRQRLGRIVRSIAPDLGGGRRRDQGSLNLKRVFDAGIPVALGTDAGNPLTLHGASVFRELEAMQASGLAPRDVLVAATRNAARALDLDSTGTVTGGAVADLLVLDADPLADIRHLRDIALVIHRGEAYTLPDFPCFTACRRFLMAASSLGLRCSFSAASACVNASCACWTTRSFCPEFPASIAAWVSLTASVTCSPCIAWAELTALVKNTK